MFLPLTIVPCFVLMSSMETTDRFLGSDCSSRVQSQCQEFPGASRIVADLESVTHSFALRDFGNLDRHVLPGDVLVFDHELALLS